jgi:hypothetical protein
MRWVWLDAIHRHRIGEALEGEAVDEGRAHFGLVHGKPSGGRHVDLVGWGDGLYAGGEHDSVPTRPPSACSTSPSSPVITLRASSSLLSGLSTSVRSSRRVASQITANWATASAFVAS